MKYFVKNTVKWKDNSTTINVIDINAVSEIKVLHVKNESRLDKNIDPATYAEVVKVNGEEKDDSFTIPNQSIIEYNATYKIPAKVTNVTADKARD